MSHGHVGGGIGQLRVTVVGVIRGKHVRGSEATEVGGVGGSKWGSVMRSCFILCDLGEATGVTREMLPSDH